LLLTAGYAPAYPETRFDDPRLGPVRTALERILDGHLPYPAVIVDRHGDLVAANDGFRALTGCVAPEVLAPPVSVPRVLLHPRAWHLGSSTLASGPGTCSTGCTRRWSAIPVTGSRIWSPSLRSWCRTARASRGRTTSASLSRCGFAPATANCGC